MTSLQAENLTVTAGGRTLLQPTNFALRVGTVLGIVGPSGSGKTLLLHAILDLLVGGPVVSAGRVLVDGQPLTQAQLRRTIGLLAQDSRGSLDPLRTAEQAVIHAARLGGAKPTSTYASEQLSRVGFANPAATAGKYPHELSGGMAQRVATAVALARGSRFLLCDEPTTGLDAAVQRQVVQELRALTQTGVVFVTHDIGLLDGFCDEVLVIEAGQIVDRARQPNELCGPGKALVDAAARLQTAKKPT